LGFLKFDEPFKKLFNQGMLSGEGGEKMSKSKGNVINPDEVSKKYGMDISRFFLLSLASPDKSRDWSENGIQSCFNFLSKIFSSFEKIKIGKSDEKTESKLNKAIKEITEYIENFRYNLAIIKLRDLFEALPQETSKDILEKYLKLLHPFCPHITEELWEKLGNKPFISLEKWPIVNESKINEKFEQEEKIIESTISDVNNIKKILNIDKPNTTVIYPIPSEARLFEENDNVIKTKTASGAIVVIPNKDLINNYPSVNPENINRAKKAKPGKPGIFVSGTIIDWL
jgi:leucyl-tRNA synthetase